MKKNMLATALLLLGGAVLGSPSHASGTWTQIASPEPVWFSNMILETDGTVLCANGGSTSSTWYKLTPDIHGSYINGTWSQIASMNYSRLYYASQILQNGDLYVVGGEYGTGAGKGEIYNPLTNAWTELPALPISATDTESQLLPNGSVLQSDAQSSVAIYTPSTNSWSGAISTPDQNEACWSKLPDDSILTVDSYGQNSSRFIPATDSWVNDATVPVAVFGYGGELGSSHLLPNGDIFQIGATSNTAIYTPTGNTNPGTWVAGPTIPNSLGAVDAPAAMETTGTILCALGITTGFGTTTSFYEYNYLTNSFTEINGPTGTTDAAAPYSTCMLDLPDGSVLYQGTGLYEYMPSGTPLAAGKPVINSVSRNADGSYLLTGTGLDGISQGAKYGDDKQMDSNYPIVRLTDNTTGDVYYMRTFNWSSTSVMTGSRVMTTDFAPTGYLPPDTYSLVVVTNGIASDAYLFTLSLNSVSINCGGAASGNFAADEYFSGGGTASWTNPVDTSLLTGVIPPQAVLQCDREANFTYTIPGFGAGSQQTITMYFDENYWSTAGSRLFNVSINGTQVLTNFDIYATAGAKYKAVQETFNTSANSNGQVVITFTSVKDQSSVCGITISSGTNGIPPPPANLVPAAGNAQVALTWSASTGATSYDVYRGTTSNGEGSTPIATGITTTSYTDSGLTNGTTYYYKVTAVNSSGTSGDSNEAVATPTNSTTFISINAGGGATGSWVADTDFTGGGTVSWTNAVDTSLLTGSIPPQAVLQTDREGNFTYTITGMTANSAHTVTLYFVEQYWNSAGKRIFTVSANGTAELINFDVYAAAGADNKAVQRSFSVNADSTGKITLTFVPSVDQAKVGGIVVN